MSTVSVSGLKANLSRYLREVRRGSEVQVLDRGKPVARLVLPAASQDGARDRLVASGLLRPGPERPRRFWTGPSWSFRRASRKRWTGIEMIGCEVLGRFRPRPADRLPIG